MNPTILGKLAEEHVKRYSERVICGLRGQPYKGSNVRIDECGGYLKLWGSMLEKGMDITLFTPAERNELLDAVNDSSYRIHILKHGSTLCGHFWPEVEKKDPNALWVGFEDKQLLPFANCQECCEKQEKKP